MDTEGHAQIGASGETIATCKWRLRRVIAEENHLLAEAHADAEDERWLDDLDRPPDEPQPGPIVYVALPSADRLLPLIRYEAHLDHQRRRALRELRELQALRSAASFSPEPPSPVPGRRPDRSDTPAADNASLQNANTTNVSPNPQTLASAPSSPNESPSTPASPPTATKLLPIEPNSPADPVRLAAISPDDPNLHQRELHPAPIRLSAPYPPTPDPIRLSAPNPLTTPDPIRLSAPDPLTPDPIRLSAPNPLTPGPRSPQSLFSPASPRITTTFLPNKPNSHLAPVGSEIALFSAHLHPVHPGYPCEFRPLLCAFDPLPLCATRHPYPCFCTHLRVARPPVEFT